MDCRKIKELIPLFLDQELTFSDQKQVEAHVSSCAGCQEELRAYRQSWELLKDLPEIEPAPAYVSRFWTKVSSKRSALEVFVEGINNWLFNKRLVPAAVTACTMIIVGSIAFQYVQTQEIQHVQKEYASLNDEQREIVDDLVLLENLELLEDMEMLEDMDFIDELLPQES